ENYDTVPTPMVEQAKLKLDLVRKPVDHTHYRSMIGSLMYVTSSRPDIMFATCMCARYQANPNEHHVSAVKRIFRYLKGTINLGLWYPKDSGFDLTAYLDPDHAGCHLDRKTESEYVTVSSCCAQVLWMRTQLTGYGFFYDKVPIYCDKKSAIAISCNLRLLSAIITMIFKKKKVVKTSSSLENEPCCSKACKKNTERLNSKIIELTDKLCDSENMIFHYKAGLAQVEARLAEHRNRELKYCEKISVLEFKTESSADCIESLKKELELIKKEKEGLDSKLAGFQTASKDLDNLLESQRSDKNKEGLGYSVVPPLLLKPSPTVESTSDDVQNKNTFDTKTEASPSTISPKPFIKFVKPADSPTVVKTEKKETVRKPSIKYAELYRKLSKKSIVKGNQRNWNNLKSQLLGTKLKDSVRTKKSRGTKSKEVVDYILQVKKKLLTKKLEDSEAEHQV
nr:hypothetical protein [Tanacetum cinerariifolium]